MLGESGGLLLSMSHIPEEQRDRTYKGYGSCANCEELMERYRRLMEILASFTFLAGFCYTQPTDIEQEVNSLLTYDRQPKVDPGQIADLPGLLLGPVLGES